MERQIHRTGSLGEVNWDASLGSLCGGNSCQLEAFAKIVIQLRLSSDAAPVMCRTKLHDSIVPCVSVELYEK